MPIETLTEARMPGIGRPVAGGVDRPLERDAPAACRLHRGKLALSSVPRRRRNGGRFRALRQRRLSDEFHDRLKDLFRGDICYAGKPLAAFFGIIIDIAAGARDFAADYVAFVFMTPFVPILSRQKKVDDIPPAQGREMARARIIADENRAEREEGVEIIEGQPLVN